jgi:hypothetical protein
MLSPQVKCRTEEELLLPPDPFRHQASCIVRPLQQEGSLRALLFSSFSIAEIISFVESATGLFPISKAHDFWPLAFIEILSALSRLLLRFLLVEVVTAAVTLALLVMRQAAPAHKWTKVQTAIVRKNE